MSVLIDTSEPLLAATYSNQNVVYSDLNPRIGINRHSELIYDEVAVIESLRNLLQCPVGDRGRIFSPEYGAAHFATLQEPLLPISSATLRAQIIQCIERWEPRVQLIYEQTAALINDDLPGYSVVISFVLRVTQRSTKTIIDIPVIGS
jgi:phage baseplate assembly protein W